MEIIFTPLPDGTYTAGLPYTVMARIQPGDRMHLTPDFDAVLAELWWDNQNLLDAPVVMEAGRSYEFTRYLPDVYQSPSHQPLQARAVDINRMTLAEWAAHVDQLLTSGEA